MNALSAYREAEISVVIPCFNAGNWLAETIESVLRQSVLPKEIIVVDDGSQDDSAAIASAFGEPVRLLRQVNSGESVARNRGIDAAKGRWIAFLDADDIWEPEKLAKQLAICQQDTDVLCVHTAFYIFGMNELQSSNYSELDHATLTHRDLILRPLVHVSTAMVRREVPLRFPSWTCAGEDMIYFADLSRLGRFAYVPDQLVGYRSHERQQHLSAEHWISHTTSRLRWLDLQRDICPTERRELKLRIQEKPLKQLRDFRRTRRWPDYWQLRLYLEELDWPNNRPSALGHRILPPIAYVVKDALLKFARQI